MNWEIFNSIQPIFEQWIKRIGKHTVEGLAKNQTDFIIAYSGGKDSSLLVLLFQYLSIQYKTKPPTLYHLSHGIRNINDVEAQIKNTMLSFGFPFFFLKKISLS
ncbi:ATP-binding protein [Leptospira sp. 96542]|nr:ATP-binding protein [Leptospira sp. 96542]